MVEKEVTVLETEQTEKQVLVEFPVYRNNYGVTRIGADGTAITVQVDDDPRSKGAEFSVSIEHGYNFTESSGREYHLGEGIYSGNESQYRDRLKEIEEAVKMAREVLE